MSSGEPGVYDIIFAGGGAAACITAGRLAKADPNLKILIVEAGPHTRAVHDHVQPGRYFSSLTLPKETFTFHVGKPSDSLLGRPSIVPTGRAVGGGSSVNFMVYNRAPASDYNDWENVYGNKGWGSSSLIPLLKKAETYQEKLTNDTHGTSGPIKVSFARENFNIAENFLEVAKAIDQERPFAEDMNDFSTVNGYGRVGRDTQATGIEYVDDSVSRGKGEISSVKTARASRLVVLSAGSFGTPSILERSGIGATSILEKNGVTQVVDLPGVGEHYLDHNVIFLPFVASEDTDTMDHIFRGPRDSLSLQAEEKKWLANGQGLLAHNGIDAAAKLRPNAKELASLSPNFDSRWETYFLNVTDRMVLTMAPVAGYVGLDPSVPLEKHFSIAYFLSYPISTGRVHITSGTNPYAPLDFESGFLDNHADLVVLRWGYKRAREFARRLRHYRGDLVTAHPQFKPGSAATTKLHSSPVELSAPDIIYSAEDDEAIDEYTRKTVQTSWHSLGTCAMKPRDQGGVVDERLNVYGVQGLKIADCSIAPANVGSNTYNTAIAIGEKAAVIIAEELGIKGVSAAQHALVPTWGTVAGGRTAPKAAPSMVVTEKGIHQTGRSIVGESEIAVILDLAAWPFGPADLSVLRWGYKRARELARRLKYYRGELVSAHPQFEPGSAAAISPVASLAKLSASEIVYSAEDDKAIDEYTRKSVATTWHSPRDQGGVVDEPLNVYGVQGLKVADGSIAPSNVGTNTYSTVIAIGERATVIIAEDLGIKGVGPA
ncbi:FAD/NAD(P)-binding domain-containing protein [Pholiota conissans]|uniref:pyranose dehydrogenase (acceptor) n=1 Tax=Pholiota conissans TaxID=109636 RepID=A0A9P5YYY1_9AGAR|nr:FAD/NAD(P)-binding domain-containing protein [Pholiota conissans]